MNPCHTKNRRQQWLATSICLVLLSSAIPNVLEQPASAQVRLRGNVTRTMNRANRQYQLGKWEEAEKIYTQSVKRYPNNSLNWANLGIVQAELFKLGASEKSAQRALKINPKNPYAHIAQGIAYRNRTASSDMTWRNQRGELLQKAINEFKTALKYDPNNPDAYNRLGEIYRMQGRIQEADEAFTKAIELDPKFSEAISNKGTIVKATGTVDEAIALYKEAIKHNSKNYKAHYLLGEALADKGQYHEAYNALNTALYQNRNSEIVYTKMGDVLERQGNESAAISKYREAIRVKPEYVPAYQHLAHLFDNRGDGEFAMAELKSALNANPHLTDLKLDLGRLALASEKHDQALRYYQEVLSQNPSHPVALKGLATTYMSTAEQSAGQGVLGGSDKYVDAEIAIQRALQANPNDISLHLAMLQINQLSGKPTMAQKHLEYITQHPPRNEAEHLAQAEAFFMLGRYQESDESYRKLLSYTEKDLNKQLILADTMKINGDLDMATETYQNILSRQPENLKAQRGVQRVHRLKEEAGKQINLANALNSRLSKKKQKTAKDFYLESVSIYPRQPEARLELAKIYNREDNYGKAIFEYESYLNLLPELEPKKRDRIESKISRLRKKMAEQTQPLTTQ